MIFKMNGRGVMSALFVLSAAYATTVQSAVPIGELACKASGFETLKVGSIREVVAPGVEAVMVFRVAVVTLKREALRGHDLSGAARMFALRAFSQRIEKQKPVGRGEYELVAEGVQAQAMDCHGSPIMVFWVPRSKLRWEQTAEGATGETLLEVRRMLDGQQGLRSTDPPRLVPTPPVFIDSQ